MKKLHKRFRIYPYFALKYLDRWLSKMSAKGLHLVKYNLFVYSFEEGEPKRKVYFSYSPMFNKDSGKYGIELRHPFFQKLYGVSPKHSKLNAFTKEKRGTIIEVDTTKTDVERDVGFGELVSDRDSLYRKLFIRDLILFAVLIVLVAIAIYIK